MELKIYAPNISEDMQKAVSNVAKEHINKLETYLTKASEHYNKFEDKYKKPPHSEKTGNSTVEIKRENGYLQIDREYFFKNDSSLCTSHKFDASIGTLVSLNSKQNKIFHSFGNDPSLLVTTGPNNMTISGSWHDHGKPKDGPSSVIISEKYEIVAYYKNGKEVALVKFESSKEKTKNFCKIFIKDSKAFEQLIQKDIEKELEKSKQPSISITQQPNIPQSCLDRDLKVIEKSR